jgi:hypothetical protein
MLERGRRAVAAFFYADESPINLGVARIAVFLALLWGIDVSSLVNPTLLPAELIRAPIGMGWLEPLVPARPESALTLLWLVRVSACLAVLGVMTRVSTAVAAIGSLFLLVIPNMYGHVAHVRHHLVWFTALLAASRCGDALSVDAWWRRVRGRAPRLAPAPCYGFPLRAMAVVLGVSYFFAGVAKLAVGPDWFLSHNLAYLAAKQAFSANGAEPIVGAEPIGMVAAFPWWEYLTSRRVLEPSPWLAQIGGIFTILFEVGFVFAVLTTTGRLVAAAAGVMFHNFTRVFLGIGFDELLLCYPFLVDVDGWARWLGRRLGWTGTTRDHADGAGDGRRMQPSTLLVVTAAFFVLGNATFGLLRIGRAWPVAAAPRFDVVHSSLFTSYVVSGVGRDGTGIHVRDGGLGGPVFGRRLRDFFRARQFHAPGLEDPGDRLRRWQVLCAVVWNHHPGLADATDVRFSLVDVDLAQGAEHPRVLGTRELFRCNRADEPSRP